MQFSQILNVWIFLAIKSQERPALSMFDLDA